MSSLVIGMFRYVRSEQNLSPLEHLCKTEPFPVDHRIVGWVLGANRGRAREPFETLSLRYSSLEIAVVQDL
jgi:hypothetical protein